MKRTKNTKRMHRKFLRVYLPGVVALALGWATDDVKLDDQGRKTLVPAPDQGRNSKTVREAIEALPASLTLAVPPNARLTDPGAGFKTTLSVYPKHIKALRQSMRRMGVTASQAITTALVLKNRCLQ